MNVLFFVLFSIVFSIFFIPNSFAKDCSGYDWTTYDSAIEGDMNCVTGVDIIDYAGTLTIDCNGNSITASNDNNFTVAGEIDFIDCELLIIGPLSNGTWDDRNAIIINLTNTIYDDVNISLTNNV